MNTQSHKSEHFLKKLSWVWLVTGVTLGAYLVYLSGVLAPSSSATASVASANASVANASFKGSEKPISTTRNIEDIRVGDRVLAKNPEISAAERASWEEPDWSQWMKLSLLMPKPDGSELSIQILRPEDWVISQIRFVVDEELVNNAVAAIENTATRNIQQELVPPRPVYQYLANRFAQIESHGLRLVRLSVEMDLPELGLTGNAILVEIEPLQGIQGGGGSVVTATFHHTSGGVIDLVVGVDGGRETIGTTRNHPVWSVDRQEYTQASALEIGDRVLTLAGDIKRVVNKLPRPGPEPVHNLEVYGEHVYFVGRDGILVHNAKSYARNKHGLPIDKDDFDEWWDSLSNAHAKRLQRKLGDTLGDKFRDGGKHEWLMVSRAYVFKEMGFTAKDIRRLSTLTVDLHPRGGLTKGWTHVSELRDAVNSTTAHNALLKRIDDFYARMHTLKHPRGAFKRQLALWADDWMKNGVQDLPRGLGGTRAPLQ